MQPKEPGFKVEVFFGTYSQTSWHVTNTDDTIFVGV